MMKKIFIVGCPRSGTTLLQSFLASHSRIVSFPETHLYSKTISINPIIQTFTLYRAVHVQKVKNILSELGVKESQKLRDFDHTFSTNHWVGVLNDQLDQVGQHFRKDKEDFLLEKTPRHLHFIDPIQQTENEAIFIHLIRNGEDVVASMSEATGNNPEEWSGERSVDKSIYWWNRSIRISRQYIGMKNNYHIRYENLLEEPERVLKYLFERIGLPFESKIMDSYHKTANALIGDEEVWKAKNTRKTLNSSDKFDQLSPGIKDHIKNNLIHFDFQTVDISRFN